MKQTKLTILAASTVLGLALLPAASSAQQVTPGGPGERHANETPSASTKAMKPAPAHRKSMSTTNGMRTGSHRSSTTGMSGHEKRMDTPMNKN